jgi:Rne/Rng family ribonuclease
MAKEICISSTPHETRLAILEDDQLAEIYYERENEYTLAGSIYNGRVTRVLPGMQSAFVDIGLERDAFLYVTDFIELDDQEETDELEKAAVSNAGQPPREVRHPHGTEPRQAEPRQIEPRQEERRSQRQEPKAAPRQQAPVEEEVLIEETVQTVTPAAPQQAELSSQQQEDEERGARRWRGRRRRRGGRGQRNAQAEAPQQPAAEPAVKVVAEPVEEAESLPEIHASEPVAIAPEPRRHHEPKPFVLPGESLSKYSGEPAAESAKPEPAPVRKPASTFKPSTLIETPITWDGSGLLPGESLSRHRDRQPEASEETPIAAPKNGAVEEEAIEEIAGGTDLAFEESDFDDKVIGADNVEELASDEVDEEEGDEEEFEDEEFEETDLDAPENEKDDEEPDASASFRIDPTSPSGFRLFGFGKKKKEEEKPAKPASNYKPGKGVVEEEVIEEEEFERSSNQRRRKPGTGRELDDYEEQTLPNKLRTGDLGEMLQEAHLDHSIQKNFDEKSGEENEELSSGSRSGRGRRERGGRGGRGRGGHEGHDGRRGMTRRTAQTSNLPIISDLLKPGQEILVQIAKEPIAKKGARITSHIALPGRFLVFMPTVTHVGVSRKIASDEERHRLKRILLHERGEAAGGFIVRTAAEGASEEELRADLRFLINLWNDIKQRSEASKSPSLIYHDLSLIERILRDQVSDNFANIWVDSEADYERIVRFLNHFSPTLVRRVKLYNKETPLFEHFGIEDEISKALHSKVWLKSGGSIVINQTEALVAIDINTGKYVGKSARLEDTIVKTNLDAVPEIVRQIRLRDLGGIIIIDFIDMDERKNRFKVMAAIEEALKSDRAPTKVLQFNDFGLVAITRKRVKQSLERTLSVPCPTCQATGMVKSPATVCNEIYIEMRKMRKHFENSDVTLRVHPETVKALKANNARWMIEFEELIGRSLLLKSDPTLHPEQFDIQG